MAANVVEVVISAANQTSAGMDEAKAQAEETGAAYDKLAAAMDRVDSTTLDLEIASAKLAQVQADEGATAEELAAAQDNYTRALDRAAVANKAAADAQDQLTAVQARGAEVAGESADAQEAAAAKTDESAAAAGGLGEKWKLAGLAVAAGAAIGIKMAGDMDQATARLVTSAGESERNLGMVRNGLLSLSVSTGQTMQQLEAGMYTVESAGYHGAEGLNVLKAAAEGAAEEGASVGTMANAVTSGLNAYGLSASHATSFTNQMMAAVGAGKMTLQDLAGSLSAVLPVASAAHLSFAQVAGGMATMTAQGTSAQEAAQLLRHTITSLQGPSGVQIQEMQQLGLSSNDLARNLGRSGLTGTIDELEQAILQHMGKGGMVLLDAFNKSKLAAQSAQEMIAAMPASIRGTAQAYLDGSVSVKQWNQMMFQGSLPANMKNLLEQFATVANGAHGFNSMLKSGEGDAQTFTAALSKVMGGAEGLQVALQVGGAHMSTFKHNVDTVGEAATHTGANIKGWSLYQSQFNTQMAEAKGAVEAVATSFGQALMPAVQAVLHPIVDVAEWFAKTSGASTALAVVVGGVLTTVLATKLASGLTSAKGAVEGLWKGFGQLKSMLPGVGEEAAASAAETEALTAATEGQAAATEAATGAQEGLDAAMDANPIGALIMALVALGAGIYEVVTHWRDFERWGLEAFHAVEAAAEGVWGWIKGHWPMLLAILTGPFGLAVLEIVKHWHDITSAADDAIKWVESHWPLIFDVITGPIGMATRWVVQHWDDILHGAEDMIGDVTGWFRSLPGRILGAVGNLGHLLWSAGADLLRGLIGGIDSMVGDVVSQAASIGGDVLHGIEGALGIGSPSKYTRQHGVWLMQGLIDGMDSMHGAVAAASERAGRAALGGTAGLRAGAGGYGAYAGAGGGSGGGWIEARMVVQGNSDPLLTKVLEGIKLYVREVGGGSNDSVQRALGQSH